MPLTFWEYCLINRSFRLPKTFLSRLFSMKSLTSPLIWNGCPKNKGVRFLASPPPQSANPTQLGIFKNRDGFCGKPLCLTSKCRCGPVERPVLPTSAIFCPRTTTCPTLTISLGGMGIAANQIVAVVNIDHITIFGMIIGIHHYSTRCRYDRRSRHHSEVDPFMKSTSTRENGSMRTPKPEEYHFAFTGITDGSIFFLSLSCISRESSAPSLSLRSSRQDATILRFYY